MKSKNPSQIGKIDMKPLMMVPFLSKRSFLGVQKKRDFAWEPLGGPQLGDKELVPTQPPFGAFEIWVFF